MITPSPSSSRERDEDRYRNVDSRHMPSRTYCGGCGSQLYDPSPEATSMSWAAMARKHADDDADHAPESEEEEEDTTPHPADGVDLDISLEEACAKLWEIDSNRLEPGTDFALDVQGYTHFSGNRDYASRPLFAYVNDDALGRPTYSAFKALLDNYNREVGSPERETSEERREIRNFINVICRTAPMKFAHAYLAARGEAPEDIGAFKRMLVTLWFKMYRSQRGGPNDSCGFEHVFVGEEKDRSNSLTGFHNWIQLYIEEQAGRLDYHGYISRNRDRPAETAQVLTMQFTAIDAEDGSEDKKPMSTSFIGVSPEFEIALYTVVALLGKNEEEDGDKEVTPLVLGEYEVEIHCVKWGRGHDTKIRTCYPKA